MQLLSALLVASSAFALPKPTDVAVEIRDAPPTVEERQSCYATCGNVCYYQSDIDDAVSQGYSDYQDGDAPGGYPHTYNNYEGFDFPVNGPYQEFPVLNSL